MKKIALLLLLLVAWASYGQDDPYKNVVDRITIGYNKGDYKSVYTLFAPSFRQKVPEQDFITFLGNVASMGKIISTEYSYDKEGFKVYKTTMEHGLVNLIISLDDLLLVSGFAVTPYKEPLTSTPPEILTNNKKVTPLDKEVDKTVAEFITDPKNAGLSIVIIKDGQTYFYHYGETKKGSKQLPDNNTIYEIGSITKTFTGILLAKAIEDQKVSLYDDVRKFLPVKCSDLAFGNHPIILKHLANHTSQIPRIPENLDQQPYFDPKDPYKNYNPEILYDYLSTLQLKAMPGVAQEYSNTGMGLLGLILEKIYAMDYDKLMKTYIAKPLKMNSTHVKVPDNLKGKFATGYFNGTATPNWDFNDTQGFGALDSTPGDMALYLQANIDNVIPYVKFSHEPTFKNGDESTGLGWFILKTDTKNTLIWHNGGTYGFSSFMGYIKEKKCGIVILGNSYSEGGLDAMGSKLLKYMQQ
jgi:CubicO group peptidase (beta-lactamase class C family)